MEVVIGIVFSVFFVLFFLQNKAGAGQDGQQQAQVGQSAILDVGERRAWQQSSGASGESSLRGSHLPQDSVLLRHYVAHVRQMVEDLAGPQPSDSVLRRHHEQLVASKLDECLTSENRMNSLNEQFDAFRRAA